MPVTNGFKPYELQLVFRPIAGVKDEPNDLGKIPGFVERENVNKNSGNSIYASISRAGINARSMNKYTISQNAAEALMYFVIPGYIMNFKNFTENPSSIQYKKNGLIGERCATENAGYMGLYGGMDVDDIHAKKQLEVGQKILDYMGSTELIANLFRISQTEEKIRKDKVQGADKATSVHYNVGREVRNAIEKIGGTMPEDLPTPEKSIQQIEKEQMERLKNKAKKGLLMLDE